MKTVTTEQTLEAQPAQPHTAAGNRRLIALYGVACFLYWIALYLYMPTLPAYAQSKTDSLALVGTAISMYGLVQAVVRLPVGILSDWLGRRKVFIVVGFVLAGLGAYVTGAAGDISGIIAGRAIVGLAAATWVPLVVAFSGLYRPEEAVRASAMLTFIGSVGRVLATAANGPLNNLGARLLDPAGTGGEFSGYPLAYYIAAAAALLAALTLLPSREVRRPPKAPTLGALGRLFSRRDVILPSLLSTVSQYANWTATFGFFPILARDLGASDVAVSLMLSFNIGVLTLANLGVTRAVVRMGERKLVYLSFALLAAGLLTGALASSLAILFAAQIFIGLAQGFGYPVLMGLSIRDVSDEERTSAMGLHQSVYAIGMFAGPWLGGILADGMGIREMFGVTAAGVLLLGVAGTRLLSGARRREA